MQRLLIMASMFWPQKKSGGPPVSIMNLVKQIYSDFELYIISRNHELNETEKLPGIENGWNVFDFGKVYYFGAGENSLRNIYSVIKEVAPEVIYQNSFFSYDDVFPVLAYKKKHPKVKVVIAPRGEFYPNRYQVGYLKKTVYSVLLRYSGLLRGVNFQGTGEDECGQIANVLHISRKQIYNVQNLSLVSSDDCGIKKIPGTLRLCYIARIHPTKNTLQGITFLKNLGGQVTYDIYGSIEDMGYWNECQKAIAALPSNIHVNYKGLLDHTMVSETMTHYHGYYMPTSGENFGHSIVEAMLMGRMVVISDQTPWTKVNQVGGYAIPLEDTDAYIAALAALCDMDDKEYSKRCSKIQSFITAELNIPETVKAYIHMLSKDNYDK